MGRGKRGKRGGWGAKFLFFFLDAVVLRVVLIDYVVCLHSVLVLDVPSSVLIFPCCSWVMAPHVPVIHRVQHPQGFSNCVSSCFAVVCLLAVVASLLNFDARP